jgi:hypothetical protein
VSEPKTNQVRRGPFHVAMRDNKREERLGLEAELGVSGMSLSRWSRGATSLTPSFRRVEIVEAHPEPSAPCSVFVVHGPGGVRIEGMAVAEAT